jgi:hypothetical protein
MVYVSKLDLTKIQLRLNEIFPNRVGNLNASSMYQSKTKTHSPIIRNILICSQISCYDIKYMAFDWSRSNSTIDKVVRKLDV